MLKVFSLKNQKKDPSATNDSNGSLTKKSSAAQLRITKGSSSQGSLIRL
jgi:hypothetical protein